VSGVEVTEHEIPPKGVTLAAVDQLLCAEFGGTGWEIHVYDRRHWRFRAGRTAPENRVHRWGPGVDEVGGRPICRRCGHIATKDERDQWFFAQKTDARRFGL
jgi:hypothetical protein